MKTKLLIISLLIGSSLIFSQEQQAPKENEFSLTFQLRPRAEYRNGVLYPRNENDKAAAFINNRTRLSLDYARKGLNMGLSLQNTGVWGDMPQINKSANVSVYEAWAKLSTTGGLFAKFGRQSLVYDDERLLGALDWNVNGRSHDAIKLGFENKEHKLHAVLAFNQNEEKRIGGTYYIAAQPYKTMQTLWYQFNGNSTFKPSVMIMNLGYETGNFSAGVSEVTNMQTIGTFMLLKPSKELGLNFSGYYQTGNNAGKSQVSAYLLALKGMYDISPKVALTGGVDYLSGEGNTDNHAVINAFNPLFGTHHKFYGAMDYFFASSFANNLNPGLADIYVGINVKPETKLTLSANYHYFSTTSDVYRENLKLNRGLGSEIDLQCDWAIAKDVKLSGGYSTMFGTASMDFVKGGNHSTWQDWGWLSINVSPRIFYSKW